MAAASAKITNSPDYRRRLRCIADINLSIAEIREAVDAASSRPHDEEYGLVYGDLYSFCDLITIWINDSSVARSFNPAFSAISSDIVTTAHAVQDCLAEEPGSGHLARLVAAERALARNFRKVVQTLAPE
jgi:hypothetical protein